METNFTLAQLADPRLKEASEILQRCVHCGFCTATCPTYLLLGDERDSPRGRIYLIKSMLEGEATARQVRPHMDRCLSCYSCMTTCPSGVDYMHLSDYARQTIEKNAARSPFDRFIRIVLSAVLPYPKRFRLALRAAIFARPFKGIVRKARLKTISAMLDLAPRSLPRPGAFADPQTVKPKGWSRGRVALLSGCAQRVLRPGITDATVRFLTRQGFEVELAAEEGCCGALVMHMGKEADAKSFARRNIDAWHGLRGKGRPLDAIIVNASGCGTAVKDYGHLFAQDSVYAVKAKFVSSLAKDIAEFAAATPLGAPRGWSDIRVAYHSACSMQHAQQLNDEPRQLLRNAGFTVLEIPEGHICCGSAGAYNILQPDIAAELKQRKLTAIARLKPDCIASGNIGCIVQLSTDAMPVVHTVELLDWAYGGPCPEPLKHLDSRLRPMPGENESASASKVLA